MTHEKLQTDFKYQHHTCKQKGKYTKEKKESSK